MTKTKHANSHILGRELYRSGLLLPFAPHYSDHSHDLPLWEDLPEKVKGRCYNVAECILEREDPLRNVIKVAAIIEDRITCGLKGLTPKLLRELRDALDFHRQRDKLF